MEIQNQQAVSPTVLPVQEKDPSSFNMGKDDFLMLFMEGLKNQDPMNPMKNDEMMSQIAQLGFMEQVTKMSESVETLQETVLGSQIAQGTSFIGHTVSAFSGDTTNPVEGIVDGVKVNEGVIELLIGGKSVQLGQIQEVY